MPVSIQCCGYCPVVVDGYSMLCHTQCNHSPDLNEKWPGVASKVCFCPLPTSSGRPLGWGSDPPCTVSLAHWCPWRKEGCASHHSPRNFVDSSTSRNVSPILIAGGLWTLDWVQCNVWLYTYELQTWNHFLLPIPVLHLLLLQMSLRCPGSAHENTELPTITEFPYFVKEVVPKIQEYGRVLFCYGNSNKNVCFLNATCVLLYVHWRWLVSVLQTPLWLLVEITFNLPRVTVI